MFPLYVSFNLVDILTFIFSLACSLYIVLFPICSRRSELNPLIFGQLLGMSALGWGAALITGEPLGVGGGRSLLALAYLGVTCSLVTTFIQSKFQKATTSPRAAVIYTSEPVWAAMIAFLVLGEVLTLREMTGAGMILVGILVSELA